MDVIHLNNTIYLNEPLVLTIGQFDGIHKAHQELIKKTVLAAKNQNAKSAVITFLPHIDSVIKGTNPNDFIIDMPSKIEILNNLNVDYLLIIDFNKEIASKPHQVFFQEYLNQLNILEFIVGFDFTYGHFGKGNINTIKDDYVKDVKVTIISKLEIGNEKIGSFEIKKALTNGDIAKANDLLGYNFFLNLTVTNIENNKYYLKSENLNILNCNKYTVYINNEPFILNHLDKTFIENLKNININDTIKVIFKN